MSLAVGAGAAPADSAEPQSFIANLSPGKLFLDRPWVRPDYNDREGLTHAVYQPSSPLTGPEPRSLGSGSSGSVIPTASYNSLFGGGLKIAGANREDRATLSAGLAVQAPTAIGAHGGTIRVAPAPNAGFAAIVLFLAETAAKNASNGKTTDGKGGNDLVKSGW